MEQVLTNVRLDAPTHRRLRQLALDRGISMAAALREAVDRYIHPTRPEAREEAPPYGWSPGRPVYRVRRSGNTLIPVDTLPDALPAAFYVEVLSEADVERLAGQAEALERWFRAATAAPSVPEPLSAEDRAVYGDGDIPPK